MRKCTYRLQSNASPSMHQVNQTNVKFALVFISLGKETVNLELPNSIKKSSQFPFFYEKIIMVLIFMEKNHYGILFYET